MHSAFFCLRYYGASLLLETSESGLNKPYRFILLLLFTWWAVSPGHAHEPAQYYEQGLLAYGEGEYEEAYIHLQNALQIDPNHLDR